MMVSKRHSSSPEQRPAAVSSAQSQPRVITEPESTSVPLYGFQPPVGTPYGLEATTVEDFTGPHDDWHTVAPGQ